jgi:hypothetical protein
MKNRDFDFLKCLSTGDKLSYSGLETEHLKNIAQKFESTYQIEVDAFLVNESQSHYYPICSNVLMLLNGYYFRDEQFVNDNAALNPFAMFNSTDKEWYKNYDKIIDFKKKDILENINNLDGANNNLVEYLSSSGELITFLKKYSKIDIKNFIALDLDYFALKELAEEDPSILSICCDARVNIFQENSIAIATSNSMHHIPDFTKAFYSDINRILTKNGMFIGIESQGFLSKIIINMISVLPKKLIPYSIKEIHTERLDIKKWLKKSIYTRLKESNIRSFSVKSYMFHCRYIINKS